MAKGRVYCRDRRGREVPWGMGKPWVDFTLKDQAGKTRRFRQRIEVRTKDEAEMELARAMTIAADELKTRAPRFVPKKLELGACFDAWLQALEKHPKRASAYKVSKVVEKFVSWAGRRVDLHDVDAELLGEYRDERLIAQGRHPNTVRSDIGNVSRFLKWCMSDPRQWISENPAAQVKLPRHQRGRPKGVGGWKDIEAVLEVVEGDPVLEPAYRLAFSAVCREEIAWARWEDIDWRRGVLVIPEGRGKTAARAGESPLHQIALDWLRAHRMKEGWIVPLPRRTDLTKYALGIELEQAREQLNRERLRDGKKALPGFHRGRHTIATLMVRAGTPLPITQRMLRHANPSTTARYYVEVDAMDAKRWLDKIGPDEDAD